MIILRVFGNDKAVDKFSSQLIQVSQAHLYHSKLRRIDGWLNIYMFGKMMAYLARTQFTQRMYLCWYQVKLGAEKTRHKWALE